MKMKFLNDFLSDHFILFTSILSGILCLLYVWKGFCDNEFFIGTWIVALMNFLYIPFAAIFKRKCFSWFYLVYSVILVFMIAFEKTFLFNNFTALFIVCIVIMVIPRVKYIAISLYFAAVCTAFSINGENVFHFLIQYKCLLIYLIFHHRFIIFKNKQKSALSTCRQSRFFHEQIINI